MLQARQSIQRSNLPEPVSVQVERSERWQRVIREALQLRGERR